MTAPIPPAVVRVQGGTGFRVSIGNGAQDTASEWLDEQGND